MDELLAQIAAEKGYPPGLVLRSAQARAKATGSTAEAVVRTWAGVEGDAAPAAAAAAPSPAAAPAAAAPAAAAAPSEPAAPVAEVLEPVAPAAEAEPEREPEPARRREPVPTGSIPGPMVVAFVLVAFFALLYAANVPNGPDCGQAGQLSIDPVTGVAVNCDGTAYGVDIVNFFTIGEELYTAQACAGCHGAGGGGGTGPAFIGGAVLATFPAGQCSDHKEWVKLGSAGWGQPTYGANNTPVGSSGANMPAYPSLTDEELSAVVLYERVAFGGQPLVDAESDCGLAGADATAAGG